MAGAAKQAAESMAQLKAAAEQKDAAAYAALMKLRGEIDLLKAQNEQMASQLSHARS